MNKFLIYLGLSILMIMSVQATDCATTLTGSIVIDTPTLINSTGGTTCPARGLIVDGTSNIVIDCNGSTINYATTTSAEGIRIVGSATNVTVKNCNIVDQGNGAQGILYGGAHQGTVINTTVNATAGGSYGIYFAGSGPNRVFNSTIYFSSTYGIYDANGIGHISQGNTIIGSGSNLLGIYAPSNFNGTIAYNTITLDGDNSLGMDINPAIRDGSIYENNITATGTNSDGILLDLFAFSPHVSLWNNNINATDKEIDDTTSSTVDAPFFYNNTFGKIQWTDSSFLQNLDVETSKGIGFKYNTINISNNYAGIDTSVFTNQNINTTADITLNNIALSTFYDIWEDTDYDGVFDQVCTHCNVKSYSSNTLVFNVTHFSGYGAINKTVPINLTDGCTWVDTRDYNVTNSTFVEVLRADDGSGNLNNSHAELPNATDTYNWALYCGFTGFTTTTDSGINFIDLSNTTDAHVEDPTLGNYGTSAYIDIQPNAGLSSTVRQGGCNVGEYEMLSFANETNGTTNAHVGDMSHYNNSVCLSFTPVDLSFQILNVTGLDLSNGNTSFTILFNITTLTDIDTCYINTSTELILGNLSGNNCSVYYNQPQNTAILVGANTSSGYSEVDSLLNVSVTLSEYIEDNSLTHTFNQQNYFEVYNITNPFLFNFTDVSFNPRIGTNTVTFNITSNTTISNNETQLRDDFIIEQFAVVSGSEFLIGTDYAITVYFDYNNTKSLSLPNISVVNNITGYSDNLSFRKSPFITNRNYTLSGITATFPIDTVNASTTDSYRYTYDGKVILEEGTGIPADYELRGEKKEWTYNRNWSILANITGLTLIKVIDESNHLGEWLGNAQNITTMLNLTNISISHTFNQNDVGPNVSFIAPSSSDKYFFTLMYYTNLTGGQSLPQGGGGGGGTSATSGAFNTTTETTIQNKTILHPEIVNCKYYWDYYVCDLEIEVISPINITNARLSLEEGLEESVGGICEGNECNAFGSIIQEKSELVLLKLKITPELAELGERTQNLIKKAVISNNHEEYVISVLFTPDVLFKASNTLSDYLFFSNKFWSILLYALFVVCCLLLILKVLHLL